MQRFVICAKCDKSIDRYYMDFECIVCLDCLVGKKGCFPKGKGVHLPCPKCAKWFYEETFGEIKTDCGDHDDHDEGINIFGDLPSS